MSESLEQLVTPQLDQKQQMIAFAFLSDITAGMVYEQGTLTLEQLQQQVQKDLKTQVNNVLSNTKVAPHMEGWSCATDPWVDLVADSRGLILARNTTIILLNGNQVVIGVAGTNFIENYDWFTEDLAVVEQVAWSTISESLPGGTVTVDTNSGLISKGTQISLVNTWNQKGAVSGQNLIDSLKSVVSTIKEDQVRLIVTGHSLGGAICPVTAQALYEHRAAWSGSKAVTVTAYPFAGPTVGNQAFVDYVQPKNMVEGKIDLISTYNTLDIVPHGWNLTMMGEMHDLFSPFLKDADKALYGNLITSTISWLTTKSSHTNKADNYVRWNTEATITGTFPKSKADFDFSAGAFSAVLLEALSHKDNKETRDAICKICDVAIVPDVKIVIALITPYVLYFSKFLMLLGREHIAEYYACIIKDNTIITDYQDAMKAAKGKVDKAKALKAGMDVLMQLFVDVANA